MGEAAQQVGQKGSPVSAGHPLMGGHVPRSQFSPRRNVRKRDTHQGLSLDLDCFRTVCLCTPLPNLWVSGSVCPGLTQPENPHQAPGCPPPRCRGGQAWFQCLPRKVCLGPSSPFEGASGLQRAVLVWLRVLDPEVILWPSSHLSWEGDSEGSRSTGQGCGLTAAYRMRRLPTVCAGSAVRACAAAVIPRL